LLDVNGAHLVVVDDVLYTAARSACSTNPITAGLASVKLVVQIVVDVSCRCSPIYGGARVIASS
jgi:pyrimidine operon attenuation protein/uracil phosphoribosyltransferase